MKKNSLKTKTGRATPPPQRVLSGEISEPWQYHPGIRMESRLIYTYRNDVCVQVAREYRTPIFAPLSKIKDLIGGVDLVAAMR